MDLASFDSLELNKAIAKAKLPVLTGIGHEIDETVADMVAYTSLKTPTAMAEFLINRSYNFEADLMGQFEYLKNFTLEKLNTNLLRIQQIEDRINNNVTSKINQDNQQIDYMMQRIIQQSSNRVKQEKGRLPLFEKTLELITVEATLDRGFTITMANGKAIKKTDKLKKGQEITTLTQSVEIKSTVNASKERK